MKLSEITKTDEQIKKCGYGYINEAISKVDIDIIAHFGNVVCLEIYCKDIVPYSCRNNTKSIGVLIKNLVEFLELSEENGIRLSEIKNIPIRLVFEGKSESHYGERAIGIGHYKKDKFILFDDFSKLTE